MKMLEVPHISSTDNKAEVGYYIKESSGALSYSEIRVYGLKDPF